MPYVYDVTEGIYHTSECAYWNDVIDHESHSSLDELKSCEDCDEDTYEFKACNRCHAKTSPAHKGRDITIVK